MKISTGELAARAYRDVKALKATTATLTGLPSLESVPTQSLSITGSSGSAFPTFPPSDLDPVTKETIITYDVILQLRATKNDYVTIDAIESTVAQMVSPGPLTWVNNIYLEYNSSAGDFANAVNFRIYCVVPIGASPEALNLEISATTTAPGDYGNLAITADCVITRVS